MPGLKHSCVLAVLALMCVTQAAPVADDLMRIESRNQANAADDHKSEDVDTKAKRMSYWGVDKDVLTYFDHSALEKRGLAFDDRHESEDEDTKAKRQDSNIWLTGPIMDHKPFGALQKRGLAVDNRVEKAADAQHQSVADTKAKRQNSDNWLHDAANMNWQDLGGLKKRGVPVEDQAEARHEADD
ncbi:hypothetical protein CKM354_000627300 [Cercospora kikuchii]|uniref:Uncharacterized protein n=1 Tax=Cercospora kikuchii TaxID=84275 RepID=A0A9P3CEW3_9PEZI|nr:uncharacterized protein CKM354_000627300 [Cercospora kikuchii]GIZ43029.1 hypothetical protein CKM354_000627300 [Cercospora kikuchii]